MEKGLRTLKDILFQLRICEEHETCLKLPCYNQLEVLQMVKQEAIKWVKEMCFQKAENNEQKLASVYAAIQFKNFFNLTAEDLKSRLAFGGEE